MDKTFKDFFFPLQLDSLFNLIIVFVSFVVSLFWGMGGVGRQGGFIGWFVCIVFLKNIP